MQTLEYGSMLMSKHFKTGIDECMQTVLQYATLCDRQYAKMSA